MGRIPVEFAEPGTDPTKKHHPVRVRSPWREVLPWIAVALAFGALGYVLLGGKLPGAGAKVAQEPTERPTADPTTTATVKPTVAPTAAPTATPEPPRVTVLGRGEVLVLYSVGEVRCVCNRETGKAWGDDEVCQQFKPRVCDG